MKTEYLSPEIEIVEFPVEDVITTSLNPWEIYDEPEDFDDLIWY